MLSGLVVALLLVGSAAALLAQEVALRFAAEMPRLDPAPETPGGPSGPRVGVVVAARNEETDLPALLDSLAVQEGGNLEVVVVDGGSVDRTRDVVRGRYPAVHLLEEPPLPEGWVGKNWACWSGAQGVSGEWLLFLDADVRLHPSAIRTALAWAQREGADLASIAPRVEAVGFWERVVLPFYVQMVLTVFRAPRTNRVGSRSAIANGQFWLVRRAEYERSGGHRAVREKILEDVAIARRFRAAGRTLRFAWAPQLAVTRMYRDRREMFEGIRKNVHGVDFSLLRQGGFLAALVGLFWLPLGVLPLGVWAASPVVAGVGLFLYVALFAKHVVLTRAVGAPSAYGLLYPLAVGFYVAVLASSIARGVRRRPVTWKGRSYPLRP